MKVNKRISKLLLFALVLFSFSTVSAAIIPIDLNDFYADPSVDVALDGSWATMYEDSFLGYDVIYLSNDPGMGDPGIEVPADLLSLNFDYNYSEGTGNSDMFYAWVFDPDTYTVIDELWIEDSDSGTISWDLSGIDPGITLLGLEFQLNSWDALYESCVEISNVHVETSPAPVPEPCTMILLCSALAGMLGIRMRKSFKAS
ncbi:MAG: hypothetical protein DRI61_17195 [Chloroflexi bacterium]|nr:MAG: hypothetical protein DRI61_17195 [Chloroflexota bacterium]